MVKCGPYIWELEISNRVGEISQVIWRGFQLLCCQSDQSASKRFLSGRKKSRNRSLLRSCTACLRLSYVRYRTRYRMESKSHMWIRWFGVTIFGSLQGWRTYGKFNNTLHLFHPMSHLWISCAHAWWISTTPTAQSPPECRVGAEIGQAETP